MHNNKPKSTRTLAQKKERQVAKRRKEILDAIKKEGQVVDTIKMCVGSEDKTLSTAKLEVGEEVVLQRIERALESDSDIDDGDDEAEAE
jgi:hypothetical protein